MNIIMSKEIIFMCGLPASGKTTFSKQFVIDHPNFIRIGADDVRKELYGSEDEFGDGFEIYKAILKKMKQCVENGQSFIYDAVNMKKSYRLDFLNEFRKWPKISEYKKILFQMMISNSKARERFLERKRNIPIESVEEYFNMKITEYPNTDEGWDEIQFKY